MMYKKLCIKKKKTKLGTSERPMYYFILLANHLRKNFYFTKPLFWVFGVYDI